jgi:hypothetical protein
VRVGDSSRYLPEHSSIDAHVKAYNPALFLMNWPCLVSIIISAATSSFITHVSVAFERKPRSFIVSDHFKTSINPQIGTVI